MSAAPVLKVLKNGEELKSLSLESEVILGRGEDCVIRLEDRAISRQHAVFKKVGDSVQVEKRSAFAPLFINGVDKTSALVKEGDVISIGPYLIRLSQGTSTVEPEKSLEPNLAPEIQSEPQVQQVQEFQEELPQGMLTEDLLADEAPKEPMALPVALEETPILNSSEQPTPLVTESSTSLNIVSSDVVLGEESSDQSLAPLSDFAGNLEISLNENQNLQENTSSLTSEDLMKAGQEVNLEADLGIVSEGEKTQILDLPLQARLKFPVGSANCEALDLTMPEVSIGRGKECDVILNDKRASRKHCLIIRQDSIYRVRDLDSSNGTYVNGARVSEGERELTGNDRIQIGDTEFVFQLINEQAQVTSSGSLPTLEELQQNPLPEAIVGSPSGPIEVDTSSLGNQSLTPQDADPFALPKEGTPPPFKTHETATPPEFLGIPGLDPALAESSKPKSLIEKYRALPPVRRWIVTFCLIALFYFLFYEEDDEPVVVSTNKKTVKQVNAKPVAKTLAQLTSEQRHFIETQQALAFEHFRNKEFDQALFEVRKIFPILSSYEPAKELERYALEGKRKLEALEEERKKKEEEVRIKARVAELIEEAKIKMAQKQYVSAREFFYKILELEPDNAQVSDWKKEVEAWEEQKKIEAQQQAVQREINRRGREIYAEGLALKARGQCTQAIETFQKVKDLGASDKNLLIQVRSSTTLCLSEIRSRREPLLSLARTKESQQEYAEAFKLYKRATEIDPKHPDGFSGMSRIRSILHERSRILYTEGVLAESYSDFEVAKSKFRQILRIAPTDDIYFERAQRKLKTYFVREEFSG